MNEHWISLLGTLAGTCTTLAFVPQVWRVWKTRSVADISLGMYVVFVTGVGLWLAYGLLIHSGPIIVTRFVTIIGPEWLAYGLLIHSGPIIVTNLVTFVLAGLVLLMKVVFERKLKQRHKDDGEK